MNRTANATGPVVVQLAVPEDDGDLRRLGYLSQLRIDQAFRGRLGLLRRGFARMKELHDADGDAKIYVTTIFEDNEGARRVLERDWPKKPCYRRKGVLYWDDGQEPALALDNRIPHIEVATL